MRGRPITHGGSAQARTESPAEGPAPLRKGTESPAEGPARSAGGRIRPVEGRIRRALSPGSSLAEWRSTARLGLPDAA